VKADPREPVSNRDKYTFVTTCFLRTWNHLNAASLERLFLLLYPSSGRAVQRFTPRLQLLIYIWVLAMSVFWIRYVDLLNAVNTTHHSEFLHTTAYQASYLLSSMLNTSIIRLHGTGAVVQLPLIRALTRTRSRLPVLQRSEIKSR
jgi:hypothetical protein